MQNQNSKRPNRNQNQNQKRSPLNGQAPSRPSQNQSRQTYRSPRGNLKIPEAIPTKQYKESGLEKFKQIVFKKKPEIKEIVREPTAGGIVFRMTPDKKDIEILLIQDSKNRWTIPKGHIEPGEMAKQTAVREIGEESGLRNIEVLLWLGKINFKYRRLDNLVLMTTQIYLVHALDGQEKPTKEKWMNGIRWFKFGEALDAIEYDDIEKLMLIAKKKIRSGEV